MRDGSGRCARHARPGWGKKPNATNRATGRKLQRVRADLIQCDPLFAECKRQGRRTLVTERDHIKPQPEGGKDDDTNVQGLCFECHDVKSQGRTGSRRGSLLRGIPRARRRRAGHPARASAEGRGVRKLGRWTQEHTPTRPGSGFINLADHRRHCARRGISLRGELTRTAAQQAAQASSCWTGARPSRPWACPRSPRWRRAASQVHLETTAMVLSTTDLMSVKRQFWRQIGGRLRNPLISFLLIRSCSRQDRSQKQSPSCRP